VVVRSAVTGPDSSRGSKY